MFGRGTKRVLQEGLLLVFSTLHMTMYAAAFFVAFELGLWWLPLVSLGAYPLYKFFRGELRSHHPIASAPLHLAFSLLCRVLEKLLVDATGGFW